MLDVRFLIRFGAGVVQRGWTSWREGTLDAAPSTWLTHLRNYRAEMVRARPEVTITRPRVLVIIDAVPTPDQDSGSYRLFELLKLVSAIGYHVTVASDADNADPRYADALRTLGVQLYAGDGEVSAQLEQSGRHYRFVLLSRPDVTFKYLFEVRAHAIAATVIYDTVDLHWLRNERAAQVTGDVGWQEQAARYKRMECFNTKSADLVFTVTETERRLLQEEVGLAHVEVVPNVHPSVQEQPGWAGRSGLLFIGGFWHSPNEDAVRHFVADILPLIAVELPDVVFQIVGSQMSDGIRALASRHVAVVGFAPDVTPHFAGARVFVAPLRYGAGMKGKIGQSMSFGLPVVTTPVGAEGMALVDGEHAMIADDPAAFARAVIRLYTDRQLWEDVARNSRNHVALHFSERAMHDRLVRLLGPPSTDRTSR